VLAASAAAGGVEADSAGVGAGDADVVVVAGEAVPPVVLAVVAGSVAAAGS
jgi:hypothetical protein